MIRNLESNPAKGSRAGLSRQRLVNLYHLHIIIIFTATRPSATVAYRRHRSRKPSSHFQAHMFDYLQNSFRRSLAENFDLFSYFHPPRRPALGPVGAVEPDERGLPPPAKNPLGVLWFGLISLLPLLIPLESSSSFVDLHLLILTNFFPSIYISQDLCGIIQCNFLMIKDMVKFAHKLDARKKLIFIRYGRCTN